MPTKLKANHNATDAREFVRGLGEEAQRQQDQQDRRQYHGQLVDLTRQPEQLVEQIDPRRLQAVGDQQHADRGHHQIGDRPIDIAVTQTIGEHGGERRHHQIDDAQNADHVNGGRGARIFLAAHRGAGIPAPRHRMTDVIV